MKGLKRASKAAVSLWLSAVMTVLPAAGWWTVAGLALAPLAVVEIVKGVTALLRRKPREAGEESR